MMDQRGVLNTRIHHVLRILLTAPPHRQPQTQPAGGYQTFPSATIGRSSEEFRTKVAGTPRAIAKSCAYSCWLKTSHGSALDHRLAAVLKAAEPRGGLRPVVHTQFPNDVVQVNLDRMLG
jgi:hypothetical protein